MSGMVRTKRRTGQKLVLLAALAATSLLPPPTAAAPAAAAAAAAETMVSRFHGETVTAGSYRTSGCVESETSLTVDADSVAYYHDAIDYCSETILEFSYGDGVPRTFTVSKQLDRAHVTASIRVYDVITERWETLRIDETFTAVGPREPLSFTNRNGIPGVFRVVERFSGVTRDAVASGDLPLDDASIARVSSGTVYVSLE